MALIIRIRKMTRILIITNNDNLAAACQGHGPVQAPALRVRPQRRGESVVGVVHLRVDGLGGRIM